MAKFKVGDRVKVVKAGQGFLSDCKGQEFIITAIGRNYLRYGDGVEVKDAISGVIYDNVGIGFVGQDSFELVKSSFCEELKSKYNIEERTDLRKGCTTFVLAKQYRALHVNINENESHIQVSREDGSRIYHLTSKEELDEFIAALMLIREKLQ